MAFLPKLQHSHKGLSNVVADDIPLLLTQLEHMGVEQLIDKHFPTHTNWQDETPMYLQREDFLQHSRRSLSVLS